MSAPELPRRHAAQERNSNGIGGSTRSLATTCAAPAAPRARWWAKPARVGRGSAASANISQPSAPRQNPALDDRPAPGAPKLGTGLRRG
jgi:hypothetical protein